MTSNIQTQSSITLHDWLHSKTRWNDCSFYNRANFYKYFNLVKGALEIDNSKRTGRNVFKT